MVNRRDRYHSIWQCAISRLTDACEQFIAGFVQAAADALDRVITVLCGDRIVYQSMSLILVSAMLPDIRDHSGCRQRPTNLSRLSSRSITSAECMSVVGSADVHALYDHGLLRIRKRTFEYPPLEFRDTFSDEAVSSLKINS